MIISPDVIEPFERISLEEMGKVRLMNRIDSKFVAHTDMICRLLECASEDYFIQEIENQCNMPYYTLYFDTPDVDMYYQHQRGNKTRQKIRIRHYEGTETLPFLEIKKKNNKGRTKKKRIGMDNGESISLYKEFISSNSFYTTDFLIPQIENHFYRITLVNKDMTERITIDTELEFHNVANDVFSQMTNLGIIEWKRDGNINKSGLGQILRRLHIPQSGFSKYCIGMAVTNPLLKQNRLKPKLRMISKIGGRGD